MKILKLTKIETETKLTKFETKLNKINENWDLIKQN